MRLRPACSCGATLPSLEASKVATVVVDRKCRKCGTLWRIVARPQPSKRRGITVHIVDLTAHDFAETSNHRLVDGR